ncbi:Enoyl-CoA hydratase/isomerase [Sphingobium chlorophenolicum L-1]|uniref:Enoyl-CoA hydratase/isomerase n=1 Tax=Sphingobium chlorophenolicum L-1 TaxID=690566 RepID=F6F1U6_SPHCR|nr:enoyl-CoA hydratase-related protein [Sphingobium chlorophenolicum]AEG51512.1 Enoyl-CoA hydratase/isomerase [Sphingobium chlorophenolicum L-1]
MSDILIEHPVAHVALVTINRPDARNAINGAVARGLEQAVIETEANDDIRCVVLTGAGDRAFCAGADLKEISAGRVGDLVTRDGGFAGFVRAARQKPWIAAVSGAALAGGTEILLACDMSVVSEDASFGLPEVKRGLAALAGGLYRLPRSLPRAVALELIATGEPLSADRALGFGLINRVVPKSEVVAQALALAQTIAANAPIAVRESLVIARDAFNLSEKELEAASDALGTRLALTEDYREGPRAFVEKRAPRWTGR